MLTETQQSLVRQLLDEAVREVVADAVESDGILHAGQDAIRLAHTYPGSGRSAAEISEQIIEAAVHAGVAIEMSRPDQSKRKRSGQATTARLSPRQG
jgi:hypothetical protein